MVTLKYNPGPSDPEPYHDENRHHKYFPGTHDVPADAVEEYLSHSGWERLGVEEAPKPDRSDEVKMAREDTQSGASGESFDPDAFLDNRWQSVAATIEHGDVDTHLDAVRAAEEGRSEGSGPRKSVLDALDAREEKLSSESDDED